jgi:hypothetical protein
MVFVVYKNNEIFSAALRLCASRFFLRPSISPFTGFVLSCALAALREIASVFL